MPCDAADGHLPRAGHFHHAFTSAVSNEDAAHTFYYFSFSPLACTAAASHHQSLGFHWPLATP